MASSSSSSSSSWACSKCTFINSPSSNSTCRVCLSPNQETPFPLSTTSSSSNKPKWSCKSCTFLNSYRNNNCEICGTRASASLLATYENDEEELESVVGTVFLPLQRCKRKIQENPVEILDDNDGGGGKDFGPFCGVISANRETPVDVLATSSDKLTVSKETTSSKDGKILKVLSYNVWFREEVELHKRMRALGELIQQHSPDLICLQEVTPNIYDIFQQTSWWKLYTCSVSNEMVFTRPYFCMQLSKLPIKSYSCKPFRNSIMGRELCIAEVAYEADKPLVIATSHLESPCPAPPTWNQMYSKERVAQATEALNLLKTNRNVIFCGDMNWDDKLDGQVPLPDEWIDAWTELRPRELGYTYDTKSNKMLIGNRTLQKRLDRFLCCLPDFKIDGIEMIGTEAIPGLSYSEEKKVKKEVKNLVRPVFPSDHYGLLLTICSSM